MNRLMKQSRPHFFRSPIHSFISESVFIPSLARKGDFIEKSTCKRKCFFLGKDCILDKMDVIVRFRNTCRERQSGMI